MKHYCKYCIKEFEGRKNKIFCSSNCREKSKYKTKRKGNIKYLIKQRLREKKHYYLKGKERKKIYHRTKKFRDYQNKWRRKRKYWLEQYEKHPEKERAKTRRHRRTLKGKINTIKCNERRRKKILLLTGKSLEKLDTVLLVNVRNRDKVCVYCGKEFNNNINTDKETFDHFNCNEPLSEYNIVRCCWSCNSSKRNLPIEKILEWIERKKFIPSPIVMELINKKIKNKL